MEKMDIDVRCEGLKGPPQNVHGGIFCHVQGYSCASVFLTNSLENATDFKPFYIKRMEIL